MVTACLYGQDQALQTIAWGRMAIFTYNTVDRMKDKAAVGDSGPMWE